MKKLPDRIKVLIIGAGKAGTLLCKDITESKETSFEILGFIDDDPQKAGKTILGVKVLGGLNILSRVVADKDIEELIIAHPSGRGEFVRRVISACEGSRIQYKILPGDSDILLQDFSEDYLKHIRKVKPEDLLGGTVSKEEHRNLSKLTRKESVLITGAAGSIGSELSRQLAVHGAKKIVFFDWWENGMFDLMNQVLDLNPTGDYEFVVGDMKDRKRLNSTMSRFKPTTLFHAGAYKHVPLMESNSIEAIKNNILGTKTVAEVAIKNGVKKFVLVSSDKAVNPTNVMGATKRAAEKIVHALSLCQQTTKFTTVRFGNVVNSNGSAIPFFERQIERGGPVTVTHKEITRFFMTIPEACTLILKAWAMGDNGDLFVLDMGESIKIYDLARLLIILNGYIPEEEIMISIVGLRPGEKLYEEVLVKEEETEATAVDKVFKTKNFMDFDTGMFLHSIDMLEAEIMHDLEDIVAIKKILKGLVPTYTPSANN